MSYKDENVIINYPILGNKKIIKTKIGQNYFLRSGTVIYERNKIGDNFQTGHNVVLRENNTIGNNVSIGIGTYLGIENKIGDNVRIHTNCVLEDVILEDNVNIASGVIFSNDLHPPCPMYRKCLGGARVGKNTVIGINCSILPGIIIGKNCLIGAGSMVTKNVPDGKVVVGNPARIIKNRDELKCFKNFYKKPYEW